MLTTSRRATRTVRHTARTLNLDLRLAMWPIASTFETSQNTTRVTIACEFVAGSVIMRSCYYDSYSRWIKLLCDSLSRQPRYVLSLYVRLSVCREHVKAREWGPKLTRGFTMSRVGLIRGPVLRSKGQKVKVARP